MKNWKFIGSESINFISEEQVEAYSEKFGADIICFMPKETDTFLSHQQIILNERYAAFGYWVTEERFSQAGGRNWKLNAGWEYELLIRLAEQGTVACIADARIKEEWAVTSDFYTDAYVAGRYAGKLQEWNCFDAFIESCLISARQMKDTDAAINYLERMLSRSREYGEICQATQPVLILLGNQKVCYNVLNDMALTLAKGLRLCGKNVQVCDLSGEFNHILNKHYQAVIGFQAAFFDAYLEDRGRYLADLVHGPKLQFMFDHPFWFWKQLENHTADYYIVTHDENYVKFIRDYATSVRGSFLLPLAGNIQNSANIKRDLGVVFLGTYSNYRDVMKSFYASETNTRHMMARYLKYLRKYLHKPAEYAFSRMLADYGIEADEKQFIQMMYHMGCVCLCIIFYYREKIIATLLESGITLHVFGDSWKDSPFSDSKYMVRHNEIAAQDSGEVLMRAKVSLNILTWHKGGCNERIINSMMAGAVSVTDKSSYIEKHFSDGNDLCCFDLSELEKLPKIVKWLLEDEDERKRIADNGRKKAIQEYSPKAQAQRVIAIIQKISENDVDEEDAD